MEFLNTYLTNNLFIIFLYFLLSIFFILLGKLFFLYFLSNGDNRNENEEIYTSFFPLLGIFIFGNFLMILNFFTGLNRDIIYIFFLFLFLFLFFKNYKIVPYFKIYFINLSILLISATNIGISKDANIYHLQSQSWIRDEKIVFGLSNINPYLGYSSILEYINSILWIENNFIFLHFISLYIIGSLFEIIYKLIRSKSNYLNNIGYVFLFVGVLDNFGFKGGRNGFIFLQETFKYDQIFSSLVLISLILFLIIYKYSDKDTGISLLLTMFVFTVQTRFTGHLIFLLFLLLIINKNYQIKIKNNLIPIFLYLIFIFKNFLYSSCFWFPISSTCIMFAPWYQPKQAEYVSNLVINTNKLPNSNATDQIVFIDFLNEFFNSQIDYVINFFVTILLMNIIFILSSKKLYTNKYQFFGSIGIFFLWVYLAPTYRFGVPFFLAIYYLLAYSYLDKINLNMSRKFKNLIIIPIYFFVTIAIIRGDSILELQNIPDISLSVEQKAIEFINIEDDWWLHPTEKDTFLCGTYKYCYVEELKSIKIDYLNNYFYFKPVNENYYLDALS